jgi:hypothetical protein
VDSIGGSQPVLYHRYGVLDDNDDEEEGGALLVPPCSSTCELRAAVRSDEWSSSCVLMLGYQRLPLS